MNEILSDPFRSAIVGGILIGISVSLMLALNGRVTGLSGIISDGIFSLNSNQQWRWFFLLGLLSGGSVIINLIPSAFLNTLDTSTPILIVAGLLVGFGTRMGGGCTSGHGICGMSRLSARSIVATITFILFGMITTTFFRKLGIV